MIPSIYCFGLDGECFEFYNCQACEYYQDKVGEKDMSIVFNSSGTADTINRAVDNSMGTTTVSQGAESDGLIIKEDLTYILQGTEFTNPYQLRSLSGSVPLTFHSVAKPLKSFIITGNTSESNSVGEPTSNIISGEITMAHISDGGQIVFDADATCYIAPVELGLAYSSNSSKCAFFTALPALNSVAYDSASHEIEDNQVLSPIDGYIVCEFQKELPIINNGKTLHPYEPYDKIKIPVVCAGQTSDIYIDDVLRKSSGQDPVYDIMYSDGTLTRNVDTDGTPLQEPTTETFEPVIINTVFGSNTLTVDTTVKPSSVSIEYYDN